MLAPLLALALTAQSKVGHGSELYNDCQTYLSFTRPGPMKSEQDIQDSTKCTAYVNGFLDAGAGTVFCPRGGNSIVVYIQKYVAYMDEHPELLEAPKERGLRDVLAEALPCSK